MQSLLRVSFFFLLQPPKGMSTSTHLIRLPLNLTLTSPGDFPVRVCTSLFECLFFWRCIPVSLPSRAFVCWKLRYDEGFNENKRFAVHTWSSPAAMCVWKRRAEQHWKRMWEVEQTDRITQEGAGWEREKKRRGGGGMDAVRGAVTHACWLVLGNWLAAAAACLRIWDSGAARRADYEAVLVQQQSPLIVSMAAHALLICSLALLSALSRPGLTFTEEEFQPGLLYDEVPLILDRRWVHPRSLWLGSSGGVQGGNDRGEGYWRCTQGCWDADVCVFSERALCHPRLP